MLTKTAAVTQNEVCLMSLLIYWFEVCQLSIKNIEVMFERQWLKNTNPHVLQTKQALSPQQTKLVRCSDPVICSCSLSVVYFETFWSITVDKQKIRSMPKFVSSIVSDYQYLILMCFHVCWIRLEHFFVIPAV